MCRWERSGTEVSKRKEDEEVRNLMEKEGDENEMKIVMKC